MKVATFYLKSGQSFEIKHENLKITTTQNESQLLSYEITGMPKDDRLFWLDLREVSAIVIHEA